MRIEMMLIIRIVIRIKMGAPVILCLPLLYTYPKVVTVGHIVENMNIILIVVVAAAAVVITREYTQDLLNSSSSSSFPLILSSSSFAHLHSFIAQSLWKIVALLASTELARK